MNNTIDHVQSTSTKDRELKIEGRRLLVEFTCGRCNTTQLIPYIENPASSAYGNLRKHDIPDGWQASGTYTPQLCPQCVKAFKRFLGTSEY